MLNMEKNRSKITAMLVIAAMLASAFSIMGMNTEEAHAAAAKKPAKVTGFKVTQKDEKVTASWKKTAKVKVGSKSYAVKYQLESTVVDVFGTKGTQKATYTTTKKAYTSHPGTKFTFRVRAFYTKNGKKVYGKWTAKKSQTIKNTMNIELEHARTTANNNTFLAQAHVWGSKVLKYDTVVFEFNGQTKKCGKYDYVMFNDAKGGTLKAYAQYTAKNNKGKTKVIKTKTVTNTVKAASGNSATGTDSKNNTDPTKSSTSGGGTTNPTQPTSGGGNTTPTSPTTPTSGGTIVKEDGNRTYVKSGTTTELKGAGSVAAATPTNPYIQDYTAIGDVKYFDFAPFENSTVAGRAYNAFCIQFNGDVKTKYNWYFYPANNKVLVNTLGLAANSNAPKFVEEMTKSKYPGRFWSDEKTIVMMKTNWQCIDGYIVAFEGNKEVYCKKLGWTTQPKNVRHAPGDVSINGPYYDKCVNLFNKIYTDSEAYKQNNGKTKAQKIRNYLQDKTTYEVGNNSMNDLREIGFFYNKEWIWDCKLLDVNNYDYSAVLSMLLGLEGGSCQTFQILETFVAKQIDSNAKVEHADLSETYGNDHMAVDVDFSDGTYMCLDMSSTKYGNHHVAGTAADMYNYEKWRTYVKAALGDEACNFWFDF